MALSSKNKNIIAVIVVGIIVLIILGLYLLKGDLVKNHSVKEGIITKCEWKSRGTARFVVEATFAIDGKEYKSSCQLSCQDLKLESLKELLIDKHVPVVYNSSNPSINYLLIEQSAYELYNVPLTETSKSIAEAIECR